MLPLVLIGASFAAFALLSLARPNATQPDLGTAARLPGPIVPLTLDSAAVAAIMWAGYLVGALGLAMLWRTRRGIRLPAALPIVLAVVALLGAPIGSGDHLNYAAYGRIAAQGGNPYTESPIAWGGGTDPVTSAVEEPWTTEPSVYGPFATVVQMVTSILGGDSLRATVWWWQLVVVLSWLAIRWLLRRILEPDLHDRVDLLWTLNPLLWPIAVLGAHVDAMATALAVAAVWALHRRPGWPAALSAGAFVGLAGSTKFTYAVVGVGLFVAFAWRTGTTRESNAASSGSGVGRVARTDPTGRAERAGSSERAERVGSSDHAGRARRAAPAAGLLAGSLLAGSLLAGFLLAGFLLVVVPLHVWTGAHTYDQLLRSRQAVSLATPWRLVLDTLRDPLGPATTRTLITVGAALVAIGLLAAFVRLSRPEGAVSQPARSRAVVALWVTGGLSLAYSFAAPYALPWYDLLVWACLPAVAGGAVGWLAGGRLLLMACAYVPGRVLGMSAAVEAVTLGFRRSVAPWLALVLWGLWFTLAVRAGSVRSRGTRR